MAPKDDPVFQITFKGRVKRRSFDESIDVGRPTPYQVFVGSGGQLWRVFDPNHESPLFSGTLMTWLDKVQCDSELKCAFGSFILKNVC